MRRSRSEESVEEGLRCGSILLRGLLVLLRLDSLLLDCGRDVNLMDLQRCGSWEGTHATPACEESWRRG